MEIDGKEIEVRGLKRGEIKQLRADGIELGKMMDLDEEKREAALDRLLGLACPDVDPDEITPGEATDLYLRISELTFTTGAQEKNSESPQSSV